MNWFGDSLRENDRQRERDSDPGSMKLSVGSCIKELACGKKGYHLFNAESGFTLLALHTEWSEDLLEEFTAQRPALLRWLEIGGIGFLCFKFGDLSWGDCSYHPAFFKARGALAVPGTTGAERLRINLVCVDSGNGRILSVRQIFLPQAFSHAVLLTAGRLLREEVTEEAYRSRVHAVWASYSPEQLAQMAEPEGACEIGNKDGSC